MKITLQELREVVGRAIAEARKKTEKAVKAKHDPKPEAFGYAEAFDFSQPLGAYNLYRSQGAVNWGPMTGPGTNVDDCLKPTSLKEFVERDPWGFLSESIVRPPQDIWEAAVHWYDHQNLGLGGQTSEGIEEKKLGFTKLKNKLSHKKGVSDPAALAASIGRKKYGVKGMAKKAAAGRRK